MSQRPTATPRLALVALLSTLAAAPAFGGACDAIGFRIWRPGDDEIRYRLGETIRLEAGAEAHLYVHHASRSRFPYATSAVIGHPHDVGLRAPFDPQVLRLRPQNDQDRREGRLVFDTARAGNTNLGYRIEAVSSTGVFEALEAGCRLGTVHVEVIAAEPERPRPSASRAARELGHKLERALVFWQKATIDDDELERILAGGRQGLVRHAVALLRSDTFQDESYFAAIDRQPELRYQADRQGDLPPERVAEVLLEGIYRDLFQEARPETRLHQANVDDLLACVGSDRRGQAAGCEQLAERLIAFPVFGQLYRESLEALEAGRGG